MSTQSKADAHARIVPEGHTDEGRGAAGVRQAAALKTERVRSSRSRTDSRPITFELRLTGDCRPAHPLKRATGRGRSERLERIGIAGLGARARCGTDEGARLLASRSVPRGTGAIVTHIAVHVEGPGRAVTLCVHRGQIADRVRHGSSQVRPCRPVGDDSLGQAVAPGRAGVRGIHPRRGDGATTTGDHKYGQRTHQESLTKNLGAQN